MSLHEKFCFENIDQLKEKIAKLGVNINISEDLSPLATPVAVGVKTAANSFAALPMEGCDSTEDGAPSELVKRRYMRLAEGGYGLVWWEACSVAEEGRANHRQMWLTEKNVGDFATLVADTKAAACIANGFEPLNILQLTHSGRYSRPLGHVSRPLVPQHDPILDPLVGLSKDGLVATDEYLEALVPEYVHSAQLAKQAGFDGVDIKCCHRYLLSELLASHTRDGKFGGSFENRTRLILTIIAEIRKACGTDFIVACRFNMFDAHPYPYGFGSDRNDMWSLDPTEPLALVRALCHAGVNLLSNTAGNPYYIYPQVTRPFDFTSTGIPMPREHPLESIARLFEFTRLVQHEAGSIPVVGNGYSWLRNFIPNVGAFNIADGSCRFVGLGRSSFAYPDAPREVLKNGSMTPRKCCIACSKCTQIMRDHGMTGCVIKDSKIYAPLYAQYHSEAAERENTGRKKPMEVQR